MRVVAAHARPHRGGLDRASAVAGEGVGAPDWSHLTGVAAGSEWVAVRFVPLYLDTAQQSLGGCSACAP